MAIEIDPGTSLWDLLERRAARTPDDVFALDDAGRTMTFGQLRDQALGVAGALASRGVRAGQTVSWTLPTILEAPVLTCALDRLGVVQNPIIPMLRGREIRFITRQLASDWLLAAPPRDPAGYDHAALAREIEAEGGSRALVLERPGLLAPGDPASLAPHDPAPVPWALYTSGTSGDPKGVRHRHRSVMAATLSMATRLAIDEHDRSALAFPFTHVGGINFLMASLLTRCRLVIVETFSAPTTMGVLAAAGMTLGGVGTAFHQAYLAAQRGHGDTLLFPHVRAFPGGGAPKPPVLHDDLVRELGGVGIVAGYGLTEIPMIAMAAVTDPHDELAHTEGRPSPGVEVRIKGPDGRVLPQGADGEICAVGPNLMVGYVDRALDAAAFDAEGFFHTGDIGHLDDAGYVVVTGRLKDVIIRKGENISAKELEDTLHTHPAVAEVAVIGLPDAERGERVCAVVVPHDAAAAPTLADLTAFLRRHDVMVQKLPEQLEIVGSLPRGDTGKVLKTELRARYG